ncbi:syntaxin [Rhodotorula toruloides]|uniref:Syntaxin n=1 Tax=Rhodotorula toruloides TaxID=5286 RepID=A0A511KI19_RHOTO|nr:syntaxin [Rhodotorula toruloides]
MAGLLKLPGTSATSKDGYASLNQPIKQHSVSAGGIKDVPIELGDLANDAYFDEVARVRDGIRGLDDTISTLHTKHSYSLQAPSESLAVEITTLSSKLAQDVSYHRSRIAEIVNPDVTDEEVKQAVDTSAGAQTQVFQQAIMGARSAAAKSALNEAQSRRSELVQIEETLVQLAALMQQVSKHVLFVALRYFLTLLHLQVADLVVLQDVQIIHIESTAAELEADVEQGVKQVGLAKVSAAAARHKRKMCAAFGFLLLLVLVIIVVVEVKQGGAGGGGGKAEVKTDTVSAAASATSHVAKYR